MEYMLFPIYRGIHYQVKITGKQIGHNKVCLQNCAKFTFVLWVCNPTAKNYGLKPNSGDEFVYKLF